MMNTPDLERLERLICTEGFDSVLLETLLSLVPAGVLIAEAPSGRVLIANERMQTICGGPIQDAGEGRSWQAIDTFGCDYDETRWPLNRAISSGETVSDEEIEIIRADRGHSIVRVSAAPLRGPGGAIVAGVLTCLDISDQRRRYTSRKFLTDAGALLATNVDPVTTLRNIARLAVPTLADWCTIDLIRGDGSLERVAVEHMEPRKAMAAAELARRHPPSRESEFGVSKAIRTGRSELIREVTPELMRELARSPGHRKLLEELGIRSVMLVPLIARGEPLGAITFVSAESGWLYSSEELEMAEELAGRAALAIENSRLFDASQAATEAKSDFLAVMSHELRTPLTAIIGYSELLQLGVPEPVTPRQHEQAERIEVSARHLLQLIEEILTLVTLDSGESRVRSEQIDVKELLDSAASIMDPMARAKGLAIGIGHAAHDTVLLSDPDKLLQILLNLLSNAIKFTESGEIRLEASVEDGVVTFTVADTGIGLGPEHMERIFEPFWQVERPITRRAGGTGLGLTISRRLADLLGGDLEVESEVGAGSTFRVILPLRDGATA
ncbi:MAG: ATP-binding protein [Gemmatimonadota bacterium]